VAKDFEARVEPPHGWTTNTVDAAGRRNVLLDLLRAAMPAADAAREAGVSPATAYRWRAEMIDQGLLGKPPARDKRQGNKRR
jgi:transposase-like protein